jgi:hypothetical protein
VRQRVRPTPTGEQASQSDTTTANLDEAKTLERIERYIVNPPENSRIFTITPAIAEHLLEVYNLGNRPKKPGPIAKYAEQMAAGRWVVTGDTLKFSDQKKLRDGQNRLRACIRAGKPFQTHITFGIPDDAFAVMDQGKNRDPGDLLAIAGYKNTRNLATAVRWAYLIEEDRVKQRDTLEPPQVLKLMQERYAGTSLEERVNDGFRIYKVTGQPTGLIAGLLYNFDESDQKKAQEFAEGWESGFQKGRLGAIRRVQNHLDSVKKQSNARVNDVVRCALFIEAWNHFKSGKPLNLKWELSQPFPRID